MGDGMNHVRAMRLAELIQEFRTLQHSLREIKMPPEDATNGNGGFGLLKQCYKESQDLLNVRLNASPPSPNGDPEKEKSQLQQVILDAAARRFKAHYIYLRATAAMRWIDARNEIKNKNGNGAAKKAALQALDADLTKELRTITAEKVRDDLKSQDQRAGKWLDEDPDVAAISAHMANLS